jgi:hypothetical protein
MTPQILVIVRESPVAERTESLLRTLLSQEPRDALRIVVLTLREPRPSSELSAQSALEEVRVDDDWSEQIYRLAKESGCRWIVLPSVADRYLAGAFRQFTRVDIEKGRSIVAPSFVRLDEGRVLAGPSPFHFDYFSLLTGFNYIAPGATFIDAGTFLASGGFDRRFPNAPTFEYLLRIGPMHGVAALTDPVLETEADPFPGVPRDYAPLYALEVASLTLHAHRFIFTPGAALGLITTLSDHVRRHPGLHSSSWVGMLIPQLEALQREYHVGLGISPPTSEAEIRRSGRAGLSVDVGMPDGDVSSGRRRVRARVKAMMPTPVWDGLRRVKRAWRALLGPLPGPTS